MTNQSDNNISAPSTPNDNAEEDDDAAAETAIPVNRRQQYAKAEAPNRDGRRSGFVVPRCVIIRYGTFLSASSSSSSRETISLLSKRYHYDDDICDLLFRLSTADELHHAKSRWCDDSWQMKALHLINLNVVQKFLVSLLVLDVLILFTELAIDAFFPSCNLILRDAISCCPATDANSEAHASENDMHRLLGGGGNDSHDNICLYPLVETGYEAGCDSHNYHGVHVAHEVLFWITIVILGTFELELLFLIYLLGPGRFFCQLWYAIDFFVVSVSLFLELAFRYMSNNALEVLPGILIIFRVWRFVRIGHGLVASTYEVQEQKTHVAIHHIEELEKRLEKYGGDVPERPKKLRKSESAESELVRPCES